MSVVYSQQGAVATLTINRPESRNALAPETVAQLREHLAAAQTLESVKVIVVTGAGDKCFCAGGDLSSIAGEGFLGRHDDRANYGALLEDMHRSQKPLIARVNGDALGGGLGLVMACDIVVARSGARFGTPEIKVGLFPMMIMALMLRNLPRKKALELMFTGSRIDADEACQLGLINRAVTATELDGEVKRLASTIAGYSSAVLRLGREAWTHMEGMELSAALKYLNTMLTVTANTEDAAEGVMAFLQKRQPEWKER